MKEVDDNICFYIRLSVYMFWVNLLEWNYFSPVWKFIVERMEW